MQATDPQHAWSDKCTWSRPYFQLPECESDLIRTWPTWARQVAHILETQLPAPTGSEAAAVDGLLPPSVVCDIPCCHAAERRVVHVLAEAAGLYHVRYAEWDRVQFARTFDYQCQCKHCWQMAGEECHRVAGVRVSTAPLPTTRATRRHAVDMRRRWSSSSLLNSPPAVLGGDSRTRGKKDI